MTAIVVAPDGSNSGRKGLEHAKRRAGTIGDRGLVAFVSDRPPGSVHSAEELKRREEIDQTRRLVLGGPAKEAEAEGVRAATVVRQGDAALRLDAAAKDQRADRIVTGRPGALGPRDRPFGKRVAAAAVPATIIRRRTRAMRHPRSPIPRPALVAAPIAACSGGGLRAQDASVAPNPGAPTIDERVDQVFAGSTGWFVDLMFAPLPFTVFGVEVSWIVAWLVVGACVFTWRFRFVQFRAFGHAIALVRGDHADPRDMGELSRFHALATALSGTVGLGSVAGVAVAVSIGGPGATFWMILAGLLGMASKFAECTLGVKYRNEYPDGTVSGGPMYYMAKGFRERGAPGGRLLAALFSIFCIGAALGGGNMFQANQAHAQLVNVTGGEASLLSGNGWITGLALAALVFAVIVGGVKSIARVAARVVPVMGLLYVGTGLVVVLLNHDRLGWALGQIALGAFTGLGVAGGAVGALVQGFRRAAFSNEAGVGSSAIAHAAARTREPVTQGTVALLEPFLDTVVVGAVTALVIVISGVLAVDPATGLYVVGEDGAIRTPGGATGVELTSLAFAEGLPWFPYVLAAAVTLFAFSTMISWSYYGLKAWTYLLGEGWAKELAFKLVFCAFVVVGAAAQLGAVIDFSDAMVLAMAVLNLVALYVLLPIVGEDVRSYFARLRSGEIRKPRRRTAPD